jgi:DNA repair protein RecO
MARGVRSAKKKFSGCFELGTEVQVDLGRSRGSLPLAKEASVIQVPVQARRDLIRLAYLTYGCEVGALLAPEEQEAEKMFGLLQVWMALLETPEGPSQASRLAFEAKALTFSGLCPRLNCCAKCEEPCPRDMHFSNLNGGLVHVHCGEGERVLRDAVAQLEGLRRTPLLQTQTLQVAEGYADLLADFLQHHTARGLKSYGWVREVEQLS